MDRQSDILLESGTNELGVMEFTIGGEIFGINVAKVLEIMMACPVVPMQKAQKDIEGIFKSRDMLLTVIDLASYLGLPPSQNPGRDIFIITRFNNANFAFHVHTVVGIDRISWTEIKKPDRIIYGGQDGVATGIAEYNGRLITILDFEKIVSEISPEAARSQEVEQYARTVTAELCRPASQQRLDALRTAIQNGEYHIPTEKLADAMMKKWLLA